jgi:hypothetical protein
VIPGICVFFNEKYDCGKIENNHLDSRFLSDVRLRLGGSFGELEPLGPVAD